MPHYPCIHTVDWLNSHLPFSKNTHNKGDLFILDLWLSNLRVQQISLVRLFETECWAPPPRVSDLVRLRRGLVICFPNKFQVVLIPLVHCSILLLLLLG